MLLEINDLDSHFYIVQKKEVPHTYEVYKWAFLHCTIQAKHPRYVSPRVSWPMWPPGTETFCVHWTHDGSCGFCVLQLGRVLHVIAFLAHVNPPPPPRHTTLHFHPVHHVVSTVNQRHWRWFSVETTWRTKNTFVLCARFIGDRSGTSHEEPWHWSDLSLISFRKVESDRKCCNMKNRKLGSDQCQCV